MTHLTTRNQPTVDDIFSTSTSFRDLGLREELLRGVEKLGFEHPTQVQAALIPVALTGRDILAQSKTGTGKTAAFGLPILHRSEPEPPISALILVPTRELAIQVTRELRELGTFLDRRILAIYGGQPVKIQLPKLKRDPNIIVGTPGRVMDFHQRGHLPYDNVRFAVLDEVDRMLDIGFRDDIRRILGTMRHERQTIFVSATISQEIDRLARQYMNNPEKLVLSASSLTVSQVEQRYFSIEPWDKNALLLHLLHREDPELTLIFCRTKNTVDALTEYLQRKNIDAHAIHGDMYQSKRNRVMTKLRSGQLSILVASDLAARGLDVDDITHVVNFDLPDDPEVYVHRIGRTARAGRKGIAWSFVTPEQGGLLTEIEKLTNVEIARAEYEDFQPGPVPQAILVQRERAIEREAAARVDHSRTSAAPPSGKDAVDESKFPGGIVPAAAPTRRMGGRLRTRRR